MRVRLVLLRQPALVVSLLSSLGALFIACATAPNSETEPTDVPDGAFEASALDSAITKESGSDSDSPPVDASVDSKPKADSAALQTPITPNAITCGATSCATPGTECCASTNSAAGTCQPTGGSCFLNLQCDGPEDCPAGNVCCGDVPAGGLATKCKSGFCSEPYTMCHNHTQCPLEAPNCCPIDEDKFKPAFGRCDKRTTVTEGDCDTP